MMTEFVLVAFILLSVAVNAVLAFAFLKVLKAYLAVQIVAAPFPVAEKAVLLDKTADEVAESFPNRPHKGDVTPIYGVI